jgi:cytohesin
MKKHRAIFLTLLALLVVIGIPTGFVVREYRHERANRDLIVAIQAEDTGRAIAALKAGADPNARDHSGDKPRSFGEEARRLLDRLLHPGAKPDADARPTALLLLCQPEKRAERQERDPSDLVKALLEAGADPNVSDADGNSPLILMAFWQYEKPFLLLLAHGADVRHQDSGGNTPLHAVALWNGSAAMAESLLAAGADIEARDQDGRTPLHIACNRDGSVEVAQVLLRHHANVNTQNNEGETPLWVASCGFAERSVPMLLAAGADVNIKTKNGAAPLHMAAGKHGDSETIRALLRCHADINVRDDDGWTSLHYAVAGYNEETLSALLDAGADPNLQDSRGMTPLHHACEEEYSEMVILLLRHHVAVNIRDKKGRTPLNSTAEAAIRRPLKRAGAIR